jgi:hypothetical protein
MLHASQDRCYIRVLNYQDPRSDEPSGMNK